MRNTQPGACLGVRLKVKKTGRDASRVYWCVSRFGDEALPSIWEDNDLELLPGETRQFTATYNSKDMGGSVAGVEVSG